VGADGSIVAGQAIVQAKLILDGNTTVRIVEHPRSGTDLDSYNSLVIIRRGREQKKYPLDHLIRGGAVLRLVEVASLCSSSDQGTVFLAFEAGSTGAAEGFAVIRYAPGSVVVQAAPMAREGRIIVSEASPEKVELWTAIGSASQIDCEACKKRYSIQNCTVGQQDVECKQRPGPGKVRSPDNFMNARIVAR
jgi:hypothetical protein